MCADWWYTIRSSDIIALIIIIIYKPQSKVNDIQQYDEIACANKWILLNCTPHDNAHIIAKKWKV